MQSCSKSAGNGRIGVMIETNFQTRGGAIINNQRVLHLSRPAGDDSELELFLERLEEGARQQSLLIQLETALGCSSVVPAAQSKITRIDVEVLGAKRR